ncbi:MAG TPA: class I SAM-dependent methyltransferase [Acidimicrobiia bacterium]|nr:class I SAM-dependent methyltransferase [Acidimicrobiia bacterium]
MTCRNCGAVADIPMVDLGMSPLCESFVPPDQLDAPETFLPLKVQVCGKCWLAQLEEYASPDEIFGEYAYFSSYSDSWLSHARTYVEDVSRRFELGPDSMVVEVASNDGYLLRWFVERQVPVLGIEPAANVATAAVELGVQTEVGFFGRELASALRDQGLSADLMIGNNVLAQVPDLHDFVSGFASLLAPQGVITLEFPHLLRLLEGNQFDTIYHEHFSYFSLSTCIDLFSRHGLEVFDVEELSTHGGSLRVFLHHIEDDSHRPTNRVDVVAAAENDAALFDGRAYLEFGRRVEEVKRSLLSELISIKGRGETIAGYGAAGKGNTLLNYCGIRTDYLDFIADRNPYKIGRYTPGTHIPIFDPDEIARRRPDHILILPWNLEREITSQLGYIAEWGADFIIPIPRVRRISPAQAM